MSNTTSMRKRKQERAHEIQQTLDDLHTLKRLCMRYREICLPNLEQCPEDMRSQLETLFEEANQVACLRTPGMQLMAALEEARRDSLHDLHTFMNDVKNDKITLQARDLQQSSVVDGFSIAHAAVRYIADKQQFFELLEFIVNVQLFDTPDSVKTCNAQAAEHLMQKMEAETKRQLIGNMLFCTELKPVHPEGMNTICFFSSVATNPKFDVADCATILKILGDAVLNGTNKHKHSLLGVAAAACVEGHHRLLQAIIDLHNETPADASPSIWKQLTQDAQSSIFQEKDEHGLTPFAYIVMFGKTAWLQEINADVLKKVITEVWLHVCEERQFSTPVLSVYHPFAPLFPALQECGGLHIPLNNTRCMYLHLAALSPTHEMLYALLKYSNMKHEENLEALQNFRVTTGVLRDYSVLACSMLSRDISSGNHTLLRLLQPPKEQDPAVR